MFSLRSKRVYVKLCVTLLLLLWAGTAKAVSFNLIYDSVADSVISVPDIVGTGTFSYDGLATPGSFLFSDLTSVSYSSTFMGPLGDTTFTGPPFDPADDTLLGIEVEDIGGGDFRLVFTGESTWTFGSVDIGDFINTGDGVSHEPISFPSAGATGLRLYFAVDTGTGLDVFGDYLATTEQAAAVPEPATVALLGIGLVGLAGAEVRRRRKKKA